MKKPKFDVLSLEDPYGVSITDYANSDILSWIEHIYIKLDQPRIVLLSDDVFRIVSHHPMIFEGVKHRNILCRCSSLLFLVLDFIVMNDSAVYDCRVEIVG